MCTDRSSSHVYPSMHWAGGVSQHALTRGGVWPGEVSDQGRCLPRGYVYPGGLSAKGGLPPMHAGIHLPCEQNDWQTGIKTLPFANFVCGRSKSKVLYVSQYDHHWKLSYVTILDIISVNSFQSDEISGSDEFHFSDSFVIFISTLYYVRPSFFISGDNPQPIQSEDRPTFKNARFSLKVYL